MIDIDKLKGYLARYGEGKSISGFISFIEQEQAKNKKSGVISLARREEARILRELESKQEAEKAFDPEEDFKNLD